MRVSCRRQPSWSPWRFASWAKAACGVPEPAALLSCDIRRGRPSEQRAELAQALIDACEETLGLRSDRLVVEFTQHSPDEMFRAGRGWGSEWTPAEARAAGRRGGLP